MRVTGDLFSLTNGSTLSVLNGPLLSLSGGSILNVNGALIGFGGTGGNLVSVANSFCPCTTIGGIPVSLTGGALASNVSIAGAIKNGSLGTLNLTPNAAVIRVDGAGHQGHDQRTVEHGRPRGSPAATRPPTKNRPGPVMICRDAPRSSASPSLNLPLASAPSPPWQPPCSSLPTDAQAPHATPARRHDRGHETARSA